VEAVTLKQKQRLGMVVAALLASLFANVGIAIHDQGWCRTAEALHIYQLDTCQDR